jgi:hypothetical protein
MSPSLKDFLLNLFKLFLFALFLLPGIVMIIDLTPPDITEMRNHKGATGMGSPILCMPFFGLLGIILIRKDLLLSYREWKRLGYPTRKYRSIDK